MFANKSHTRILSLRNQLTRITKDQNSFAKYLREIQSINNELAISGSPMSNEEIIVKILAGLNSDYSNIVTTFRARDTPIAYEYLFDKLTNHEIYPSHKAVQRMSVTPLNSPVTVVVAQTGHTQSHIFLQPQSRRNQQASHNFYSQSYNQAWRAPAPQQSIIAFRGNSHKSDSRPRCQLCDKFGHTSKVCRSRSHNHMEARAHFA